MTLEEMGRDYIRQAEEIWESIQKIEQQLDDPDFHVADYEATAKKLTTLYEIHDDLMINGLHLVNYHKK